MFDNTESNHFAAVFAELSKQRFHNNETEWFALFILFFI